MNTFGQKQQATFLRPCVGYGFDEATGDYSLNADEEQFARRVSRSSWWRSQMEKAVSDAPPARESQHGPATWTITAPDVADGEQYSDPEALHARTAALHRSGYATVSYRNNL
jgi:hypothetical protein